MRFAAGLIVVTRTAGRAASWFEERGFSTFVASWRQPWAELQNNPAAIAATRARWSSMARLRITMRLLGPVRRLAMRAADDKRRFAGRRGRARPTSTSRGFAPRRTPTAT